MRRHLILVGLPGSGKSTVGRLLAQQLEAPFADIDECIVARTGHSIEWIFAEQGEHGFRELERQEVERVLGEPPGVVAPGSGWVAQPGALETAGGLGFIIYLETDPGTAAHRLKGSGTRPLLEKGDPASRLRVLLEARGRYYGRADATVVTERRTPHEVAAQAVELARSRAGW